MRTMWSTELRGLLAVVLVVAAIAFAWTRIENRTADTDTVVADVTTTTSPTTTTPTTTSLSADESGELICARAETFVRELGALGGDPPPGPVAQLALPFWRDVADLATGPAATEIGPVVTFYEDYLATGAPFDFDPAKIIVDGDKEKFEFLMTRPTNGLDEWRGLIAFGCGVDVPDKPRMSARAFDDLEERLLDRDDR